MSIIKDAWSKPLNVLRHLDVGEQPVLPLPPVDAHVDGARAGHAEGDWQPLGGRAACGQPRLRTIRLPHLVQEVVGSDQSHLELGEPTDGTLERGAVLEPPAVAELDGHLHARREPLSTALDDGAVGGGGREGRLELKDDHPELGRIRKRLERGVETCPQGVDGRAWQLVDAHACGRVEVAHAGQITNRARQSVERHGGRRKDSKSLDVKEEARCVARRLGPLGRGFGRWDGVCARVHLDARQRASVDAEQLGCAGAPRRIKAGAMEALIGPAADAVDDCARRPVRRGARWKRSVGVLGNLHAA